jgi:hypothetical protein
MHCQLRFASLSTPSTDIGEKISHTAGGREYLSFWHGMAWHGMA